MNNIENKLNDEKMTTWKAPRTGGIESKSSVDNIIMGESVSSRERKEKIIKVYESLDGKDRKEFISLLPGYLEFKKNDGLESIERPLVHGTGSYSAKRIIKEGFRPRKLSEIITGEKSLFKNEDKDNIIPISFCDPTFEKGVEISHYYSTQVSSERKLNQDLSINSEKYLGNKTYQLLEYVYGGMNKVVDVEVKRREQKVKEKMGNKYKNPTIDQMEKSKQIAQEIILNKYKMLEADDAFVYDSNNNKKNIEKLNELLNSNETMDLEEARKLFLEGGILRGEINYQNLSYYEIDKIVKGLIKSSCAKGSFINQKIKDLLRDKIESEEGIQKINSKDAEEIKNQFPVYFLLEGEGKNLVEFDDVTKAREYRCNEIVENSKIRQIQVPKKFIPEIREWLREAGLKENIVIPFEYYEMDQIIKNK